MRIQESAIEQNRTLQSSSALQTSQRDANGRNLLGRRIAESRLYEDGTNHGDGKVVVYCYSEHPGRRLHRKRRS